jgi:dTDP-4-amino-4,6-dideoxygalactose transaminase
MMKMQEDLLEPIFRKIRIGVVKKYLDKNAILCDPGKDNSCGKRFGQQLGDLPFGYDHKYTYSHIGYNLKVTDMQAAIGVAQLKELPGFIEKRKQNFNLIYNG